MRFHHSRDKYSLRSRCLGCIREHLCSLYSNERRWNTDIKQEISKLRGMLEGVKYCGSRVKGEGVLDLLG